ncbi:hypothetical protein M9434_000250 [Picochlorum sp. BPE23]|nr:hypothetical protein M9434_000250 [Picochlorum sp. BPE23]KAI8106280.1 hypothetical protein M9435_000826 [Picochlorum sp. BPE23]|mmetsp:Transcript_2499/g.5054  ORF Transcript_2499/g.5054 Transcript_2499/m.5054 type:complete len:354 (-) Transcript_2499:144-1205(-)|eukprot:CAMPEP_0118808900 /NCGR_PEP_ID=MMETSP1161-20130426/36214_1 /TAXON_ID=249345 /ORGANISM="Picochlorum oklahomensis, Strain CCMP2329" /LENGTH=353 /DNA_ID=CAMNT_0006738295 /DNA_START=185 /DNA_END=1246 /DNA_ORIENTATION=+
MMIKLPQGRPIYTPTRTSLRTTRLVQCNSGSGGLSYKSAGVDIEAGNELVKRIQKLNPSIGGFSGMVPFGDSFLVAGTDGVGTKLKLAFDLNKHDTVGIDLVAMSVNDIITSGAKPMFFLDYFATGKLDVDTAEQVVKGIVDGCKQSECQLLGGETAEMPGFYADGEYDLAGFAVGSVLKNKVIDGSRIQAGDVILGYKSSGVHSNGFSLVRKVIEMSGSDFNQSVEWSDQSLGLTLLTPTRLYVKDVMNLIDMVDVKGLVHITGGGFPENIPRVIPKGLGTRIFNNSWEIPPLFKWIQENGNIVDSEMFLTFNMGIGMIAVVSPSDAEKALSLGVDATIIGEIVEGGGVDIV